MRRWLSLWGPPLAWMAFISYTSAQSDTGRLGRVPDWVTHGAAYFLLGLLLCRALAGGFDGPLRAGGALLVVVMGMAYGICDEWHQSFVPRRHASAADVGKDTAGCALAVLLRQWRFERKR
jgi:VanZ family protein